MEARIALIWHLMCTIDDRQRDALFLNKFYRLYDTPGLQRQKSTYAHSKDWFVTWVVHLALIRYFCKQVCLDPRVGLASLAVVALLVVAHFGKEERIPILVQIHHRTERPCVPSI
jgi:hypothetical protein